MTPECPRRLPVPCPWPCSSHPCPGRSRRSAQSDAGATLAREPARSTGPAVGGDTAHDHYSCSCWARMYAAWLDSSFERVQRAELRSEEHTSELQSLMRISYAVFCLNKKNSHNAYID